jgi:hypothetical protein
MALVTDYEIINIPVIRIKFYKIIAVSILVYGIENWVLNKSERRTIETPEISFIRHISGYAFTDRVRNTAVSNALQMYALEERIADYKNKWHNHILRMDFSRFNSKRLRITNQMDEDMLHDKEEEGKIVS